MALIQCAECKKEISSEADACPHCGAKLETKMSVLSIIGALSLAALLGWYFLAGGQQQEIDHTMDQMNSQITNDALAQYRIAQKSGSKADICVQAGVVAAAFLQAKDEQNYKLFSEERKKVCKAAGIPFE